MLIGYARVSTHDQNLDLQQDALKKAGCEKIFVDEISGAKSARPGLEDAMAQLRKGDVLVAQREEKKVGFRSLQDSMDTSSSGGKLIFHVFGALAEFERNLIRDRTNAGLAAARARGRKGGRPQKLSENQQQMVVRAWREGTPVPDILKAANISKSTLYSYIDKG